MSMATRVIADKAITIRIDGTTKEQAERILDEIGVNMTTYIVSSLKALVRERKIPFDMVTSDYLNDQVILTKLAEVEKEMSNPDNNWLTRDEVFGAIRARFGYEV